MSLSDFRYPSKHPPQHDPADVCDLCNRTVEKLAIVYQPVEAGELILHVGCAAKLATALAEDVWRSPTEAAKTLGKGLRRAHRRTHPDQNQNAPVVPRGES